LRLLGIEPENCREVFNMLDTGDGVLSVQEFFEGIGCMEGTANAKDLLRTNKTVDLLVKLLCQQNQELREDFEELLRVTPGASLRARRGSLKSRARRMQSSEDVFHTNVTAGSETAASSPSVTVSRGRSFHHSEQTTLSDVMKGLETLAGLVQESRQECQNTLAVCNSNLEACNQRIQTLNSEMCDLRYDLPKGAAVPAKLCLEQDMPCAHTPRRRSQWHSNVFSGCNELPLVNLPITPRSPPQV